MKVMTKTGKELTINPSTVTVDYRSHDTAFIDALGFIERNENVSKTTSSLEFWSPPVTRRRVDSADLIVPFSDLESSKRVKKVLEESRDSFL